MTKVQYNLIQVQRRLECDTLLELYQADWTEMQLLMLRYEVVDGKNQKVNKDYPDSNNLDSK